MAIYVVMEPPAATADEASLRAVMVRDGFAFIGFIVPLVWLFWHRLWIEGVLFFAAGIGVIAAGEALGQPALGAALSFVMSLSVGLEGAALRLAALRRRGWREWGAVEAGSIAEAEIRYLAGDEDTVPAVNVPSAQPATYGRPVAAGPALGLLGYPGRH